MTEPDTNRAEATIVLNNFGSNGATATFRLGGINGTQPNLSAFISDKTYAMTDAGGSGNVPATKVSIRVLAVSLRRS